MCGFRQASSSPEDAHSPQMGRVYVRVCVCHWEAISGCVNRKGMGPGCAQVCVRSQLWNTACRLPASCLQAHGAPSPGHARSLWTLPAEPWSPCFRGFSCGLLVVNKLSWPEATYKKGPLLRP